MDVADLVKEVEFSVFAGPANDAKGRVAALRVPGGAELTRKQIDEYGKFVTIYGAKGLAYIKVNQRSAGIDGINSPIAKFLNADIINAILERTGAQDGDMIFFGADNKSCCRRAGRAAPEAGQRSENHRRKRLGTAVGHRLPDV